jgi:hypothetical protein
MFYKNTSAKDGRASHCIECNKHLKRLWYENNRDVARAKATTWNSSPDNAARRLYTLVKSRAKRVGTPFELDVSDIHIPETCPILGIPLFRTPGTRTDNSPSLDRIDNNLGYVKGNVWVISTKANIMKSNASPDELKAFARWVESFYA